MQISMFRSHRILGQRMWQNSPFFENIGRFHCFALLTHINTFFGKKKILFNSHILPLYWIFSVRYRYYLKLHLIFCLFRSHLEQRHLGLGAPDQDDSTLVRPDSELQHFVCQPSNLSQQSEQELPVPSLPFCPNTYFNDKTKNLNTFFKWEKKNRTFRNHD